NQGRPLRLLARELWAQDGELQGQIEAHELDAVFDLQAAARHADARMDAALCQARAQWTILIDTPRNP
ncbi:MAG TPA: hypothetical protein VJN44_09565, partial [Roseateles sp.]|nr:hypothetical protein [Roseateles sp.]